MERLAVGEGEEEEEEGERPVRRRRQQQQRGQPYYPCERGRRGAFAGGEAGRAAGGSRAERKSGKGLAETGETVATSREAAGCRAKEAPAASLGDEDLNGEPYWYSVINYATYEDWEDSSEEAEENDDSEEVQDGPYTTFCGFRSAFLCPPSASLPPLSSRLDVTLLGFTLPQKPQLTAEEAERNAELLVAEEERLKKKAERKRMKKKRQKDRKRQEKRTLELKAKGEANKSSAGQDEGTLALDDGSPDSEGSFNEASPGGSPSRSLEEEEAAEEELDFSSTFVSKARRKVDAQSLLPRNKKGGKNPRERKAEKPPELQLTPVEQSLVLADCGNESAKEGLFHEAVRLFTEAIKLNPQEYRLFGNRSFCYEKLQSHAEALRDSQSALSLRPGWPKGLFRQGKALLGLKQYAAAARTFQQLLPLDGFCGDAALQLQKCQRQLSLERRLGCSHRDRDLLPVETQLPLPGKQPGGRRCPDGTAQAIATTQRAPPAAKAPVRFGPIDSIRCLPRRSCAFVNYSHKEATETAYPALQGAEEEGRQLILQLKHPAHATAAPSKAAPTVASPGLG